MRLAQSPAADFLAVRPSAIREHPMIRPMLVVLLAGFFLVFTCNTAHACAAHTGQKFADAVVRSAVEMRSGVVVTAQQQRIEGLPTFCRVILSVDAIAAHYRTASTILIEVWMPTASAWNGRFLGTGNGGFGGSIRYDALSMGLKRGFAVANTDMGTYPASIIAERSYDVGIARPDIIDNWGWRATHEMTRAAKALVAAHYGKAADHAYFVGCSTGGHQGLTEVQRFPEDYDGVLAGAPGHNRTHLHASFVQAYQLMQSAPGLADKLALIHTSALEACSDSVAYIVDPRACRFDVRRLACATGHDGATCLTPAEVDAVLALRAGLRNSRTGEEIYPGWPVGSEGALIANGAPTGDVWRSRADGVFRWALGADWDARTFDRDADMRTIDDALAQRINAMDARLDPFVARGGKLIIYHGWADPIVSAHDSINYYARAVQETVGGGDAIRLFLAPGVGHCAGGAGPDVFGGQGGSAAPEDPSQDMLAALVTWVEQGVATDRIVASRRGPDGGYTGRVMLCAAAPTTPTSRKSQPLTPGCGT
jgi:feruloyl esterase